MLNRHGKNNNDGSFNWRDAVVDAGIVAGLTFFTSLGGMAAVAPIKEAQVVSAAVAAATQFFLFLAIKRKLRERVE